ncbi:GUN4 domain-containing protein (plasmid) [Calothrix sp. NIES-4071]|nr:GUN4 domain-containing protein [Calothrix sp. NIES-4071]BAZ64786.1 GUN4 domain-containing protein [Calothrix sp. NIES-4105]
MTLSGQQRKKLQDALIDAFPTKSSLKQMLSFGLEKNLDVVAGGGNLKVIVFNLIAVAESQGWIDQLIDAACKENPGNLKLKAITQELLNLDPGKSPVPLTNNPPKETNQPQKILVLTAIPHGLRLDKEIREIEDAIKRAVKRDSYEIKIRTAVRPQDIRRAIAEEQPSIVHFCGHGLEDGSLLLEDDGGNNKPVSPRGLVSLFRLHAERVKCVLLNACYSSKSAEAIGKHVNYVIGMNQPIQDRAAIVFAQGFYDGLGYDNVNNQAVIKRAYDEGIIAIELENLLQDAVPSLWENGILCSQLAKEVIPVSHSKEVNDFSPNQNRTAPAETPESRQQPPSSDDLSSARNVDYTKLRDFLKAQKWKEADQETYRMMIQAVGKKEGDWFVHDDLLNFPCKDLRTIDRLWVRYSDGHFGFSVQKQIYLCVGGLPDGEYYQQAWEKFGDAIGWRVKGTVILYDEGIFDISAPPGHLPLGWVLSCVCGWYGSAVSFLTLRLVRCNI